MPMISRCVCTEWWKVSPTAYKCFLTSGRTVGAHLNKKKQMGINTYVPIHRYEQNSVDAKARSKQIGVFLKRFALIVICNNHVSI